MEGCLEERPVGRIVTNKNRLEFSGISEDFEGDTLLENFQQSAKRPVPRDVVEKRPAKRQKSDDGYRPEEDDVDSDLEGDTLLGCTPGPRRKLEAKNSAQDRLVMPPPAKPIARLDDRSYLPAREMIDRNLQHSIVRKQSFGYESVISEEEIFSKRNAVRREDRSEVNPQFEYDRAQRHAETQELPDDTGTWAEAEKDLFYRLAMRGFEPLVPGHWSMDFKTLPQQLFSVQEQEPLILPYEQREFRAKHYLRALFAIAAGVRDRSLTGLQTEPIIKRALQKFISWALLDAGVHPTQRPNAIPVHAIATQRRNENSHDVVRRMETKLYKLACRYQDVHRVRQSVEPTPQLGTPETSTDYHLGSACEYDSVHMPTLIGLVIVSSVVAVVTLDSRFRLPHLHQPSSTQQAPNESTTRRHPSYPYSSSTAHETDSNAAGPSDDSGLRFIANFDFSTHDGYDVWDGLAMAICVMRIRKTMLELCHLAESEGQAGRGGLWERVGPERGS